MKTIIIDVRTKKESKDESYPGAINLPLEDFDSDQYEAFRDDHVALLCFSGNRAIKAKNRLEEAGFVNVSLLKNQMVHINEGKASDTIWTIDRQFRMAIGLFVGLFLLDEYAFHSHYGIYVLLIVFSGLLYSAITDNCYLKELITRLPWNQNIPEKMGSRFQTFTNA